MVYWGTRPHRNCEKRGKLKRKGVIAVMFERGKWGAVEGRGTLLYSSFPILWRSKIKGDAKIKH